MKRMLCAAALFSMLASAAALANPPGEAAVPTVNEFVDALTNPVADNRNKPERETWLQDNGFGVFVTWSVDSQLGIVISHSLVGASDDYVDRYVRDLPQSFMPTRYDADALGRLIRLSGARYAVFTTKHHSGFAMWNTKTTGWNVINTPFARDVTGEFVSGMRKNGIAVGLYYSPEDFLWARSKGIRSFDRLTAARDYAPHRKEFDLLVRTQIEELFRNYGKIDMFFNDGEVFGGTNDLVWKLQPDVLITRTAIPSPEQTVPSVGFDRAWESIITLTDQWNYKPNDVDRKTPQQVIETLIETRAKGGALLINVGLRPDGAVDDYEYRMLTTLGAWNFINQEAVFQARPWAVTHEGPLWFTRSRDGRTLYVFLTGEEGWELGERRRFVLRSALATPDTRISVLGSSGEVVEYRPDLSGKAQPRFEQRPDGLHLDIMRTQRIYNDYTWPYPLVIKLENVTPALEAPIARTLRPEIKGEEIVLKGELLRMGDQTQVAVRFETREYGGFIGDYAEGQKGLHWTRIAPLALTKTGEFASVIAKPEAGKAMVFRAIVEHPTGVVIEGNEVIVDATGAVSMP